MPSRDTESVSSRWEVVSKFFRGWLGSGRMRVMSIRNAPAKRRRPSRAPASEAAAASSGSEGRAVNARAAADSAACAEFLEAALDFPKELAGDAGGVASWGTAGDGDAVGDTALEGCQIGEHGVKGEGPEVGPQLLEVTLLVGPGPL